MLVLGSALPLLLMACGDSDSSVSNVLESEYSSSSNPDLSSETESSDSSSVTQSSSSAKPLSNQSSSSVMRPLDMPSSAYDALSSSSLEPESSSSEGPSVPNGSFTDGRDGKTYKLTTIGTQIWMAENLSYGDRSLYVYEDAVNVCPDEFGDRNGTDEYGFGAKPIGLGNGKGTDENFWQRPLHLG